MMNNCTNNFIKRVIGVTRTFNWTITTNGAAVPLVAEDLTLQLVPPRGEAVSLPFDVDDNVVSFTWQGEDQHIIGCYSLILWANYGEDNQRRVDIHNFVELIPWSDRQSGEYSDLVEETIELETADFGENIMVVDNLNSTSATDALSANMGRQLNVTKQDVIADLATIRSGAAAGATAYQKPAAGIPKTDLASNVQASLNNADAAAPQATTYTKTEVDTMLQNVDIDVDSALSTTSENPVQNKVVTTALAAKQDSSQIATINGSDITHGGNVSIVAAEGQTITIDATPTKGSSNAVSSGGVWNATNIAKSKESTASLPTMTINTSGKWVAAANTVFGYVIPITPGKRYKVTTNKTYVRVFLASLTGVAGDSADFCTGTTRTTVSTSGEEFVAPADAQYYYYNYCTSSGIKELEITEYEAVTEGAAKVNNGIMGALYANTPIDLTLFARTGVINSSNSWQWGGAEACGVLVPIQAGCLYRIDATSAGDTGTIFAILKDNYYVVGEAPHFCNDYNSRIELKAGSFYEFIAPSDANYLWVSRLTANGIKQFRLLQRSVVNTTIATMDRQNITTINPKLIYCNITSTGEYSTTAYGKKILATPRYIKAGAGNYNIVVPQNCYMRLFRFGADFSFLNYSDIQLTANVEESVNIAAPYFKLFFSHATDNFAAAEPIDLMRVSITGIFEEDWDTFNPRPSDNGYHRIVAQVNVTHPACCDTITGGVQDQEELLPDYGVICLPATYQQKGTPTRMIIYCHGAAVNYSSTVTRFSSDDLEPDYWLAEGYAVMDIEGNPFNNEDEHCCMPQAMECYTAAYKWAIEHYNICRDGVFIGGRSMGGECAFNLVRRECPIPAIAACPNVPAVNPLWFWNYLNAARRQFTAIHCGFVNQPTWTNNSPMTTAEWDCLIENFDKLVKYSPGWNCITDLPMKDSLMSSTMNIDKSVTQSDVEEALYDSLHAMAKVPIKIFGCLDDTTVPTDRNSRQWYKMLVNSGQLVELRLFESGGHHYDLQNSSYRTTITTRYGQQLTNVPVVYIEMLQFWRRYEQGH